MKTVKQTAEYTIYMRRDNRHAVRARDGQWINGDAKVEILMQEGLLTKPEPKPAAAEGEQAADEADSAEQTES